MVLGALAAPADDELAAILGREGAEALREELAARARRWAAAVAPDRAFEATSVEAAAAALHGHSGPVLFAAFDVPSLDERHARAALDDLAAGARIAVAPSNDGAPFLVAIESVVQDLLDLVLTPFEGAMQAGRALGGEFGLLRSERRLVTPGDARALLADPLAPPELKALLGALR